MSTATLGHNCRNYRAYLSMTSGDTFDRMLAIIRWCVRALQFNFAGCVLLRIAKSYFWAHKNNNREREIGTGSEYLQSKDIGWWWWRHVVKLFPRYKTLTIVSQSKMSHAYPSKHKTPPASYQCTLLRCLLRLQIPSFMFYSHISSSLSSSASWA